MPWYRVECVGDAREVYEVNAENEGHLRELWQEGFFPRASVTECSTEIESIEEIVT